MQAPRPLFNPVPRHGSRVFGKYRGIFHFSLFQSDTLAIFKINCRYEQHKN
jgi:hypothetical protein